MTALAYSADNKARVGVLISGRGSNMLSLAEAATRADSAFEIALVISNQAEAKGVEAARARGLEACVAPHRDYPKDRPAHEAAINERLEAAGCEIVCLAGFMRILTDAFIMRRWFNRLLNVHPSLLPSFRGLETHARAIEAGARIHGATVHLVRPELDTGPILAQAAVAVRWDDTPDALAARVLEQEHRIYPAALNAYLTGALRLSEDGARVTGADGETPAPLYVGP